MSVHSAQVKLGLVQMAMTSDRETNLEKAVRMVGEASDKGAKIICLPELFTSLYFPQYEAGRGKPEAIPGPTSRALSRAASKSRAVLVGGTIYEKSGGKFYNTSIVFDQRGRILARYRKVHVPHDSHYFEKNYFSAGRGYSVAETSFGKIGPLVCFDQWYPEPARICRLRGAQMLFYPTAIGWVRGIDPIEGNWQESWEAVQRGHAIANSVVVCAVNRVGSEGDMTFWGGSFVVDPFGKVLFRAGGEEGVFVVPCSLSLGEEVEEGWGFVRNRRPSTYKPITE